MQEGRQQIMQEGRQQSRQEVSQESMQERRQESRQEGREAGRQEGRQKKERQGLDCSRMLRNIGMFFKEQFFGISYFYHLTWILRVFIS
jgi:hypothetical protein